MSNDKGLFVQALRSLSSTFTLPAVLGGVCVLAAACRPGSTSPKVASIGSTTSRSIAVGTALSSEQSDLQQAYQAQLAYAQCMRTHGEPSFPDPVLTSHSLSYPAGDINQHSPQFTSAAKTCKRLVPQGGAPSAAQMQASIARMLKHSECMRTHGITNFPDPVVSDHSMGISLKGIDPSTSQFQAAQTACQRLAPLGTPG